MQKKVNSVIVLLLMVMMAAVSVLAGCASTSFQVAGAGSESAGDGRVISNGQVSGGGSAGDAATGGAASDRVDGGPASQVVIFMRTYDGWYSREDRGFYLDDPLLVQQFLDEWKFSKRVFRFPRFFNTGIHPDYELFVLDGSESSSIRKAVISLKYDLIEIDGKLYKFDRALWDQFESCCKEADRLISVSETMSEYRAEVAELKADPKFLYMVDSGALHYDGLFAVYGYSGSFRKLQKEMKRLFPDEEIAIKSEVYHGGSVDIELFATRALYDKLDSRLFGYTKSEFSEFTNIHLYAYCMQ